MKKFGLVLSAGGSRGIAHIGFLQALEEAGIRPDYITGASMGAVIGSGYALGLSPELMKKRVYKLSRNDLLDYSLLAHRDGALLAGRKLRKVLIEYYGDKTFADTDIPFACVSLDILTGETVVSTEGLLIDAVQASCTIPSIFRPVQVGDHLLVDGGTTTRSPVKTCRDLGAEVIVVVDVLGPVRPIPKLSRLFESLTRLVDVMDWTATSRYYEMEKPDLVLFPDLGDMSQYRFTRFKEAYAAGYRLGQESVPAIKKLLGRRRTKSSAQTKKHQ